VCRTAHTAVLLDGNIYIGGGSEESHEIQCDYQDCYRLDVYNLTTNQWSTPHITTPYCWFAMTALDGKLITVGGIAKNDKVVKKILVLKAGQWKHYTEMPTARYYATAIGYQSSLIVVGGVTEWDDTDEPTISTTELFDATNEQWYTCNNIPSAHSQLQAAIIDDKLYLLGGYGEDGNPSSDVMVASLDTLSNYKLNWQPLSSTLLCFSAAAVLCNKFLLAVGGRKSSVNNSQACEVCSLNPSSGQWECITKIPEGRSLPAVVSMDDKTVVIGGTNMNRKYTKSVFTGVFK